MQIPKRPFRSQTKNRVRESQPTLQAAIGRFLAVALAYAAQAPPLLPFPFAPMMCEGENISNLKVEGLREWFLPVFDPVLPYATDALGPLAPTQRKTN